MKEYICKKDFYIEDKRFASVGDHIVLLPDKLTIVNTNGQKVRQMPEILNNEDYFSPTFEIPQSIIEVEEKVNHPKHYTWLKEKCGIEVIDITRHMDFCLGNAVKYLLRAGYKSEVGYSDIEKEIEDLNKAIWYIKDRIKQLQCGIAKKE